LSYIIDAPNEQNKPDKPNRPDRREKVIQPGQQRPLCTHRSAKCVGWMRAFVILLRPTFYAFKGNEVIQPSQQRPPIIP